MKLIHSHKKSIFRIIIGEIIDQGSREIKKWQRRSQKLKWYSEVHPKRSQENSQIFEVDE